MKELITLLDKWNYSYYTLNQSSVEDVVYDQHLKELQDLGVEGAFIEKYDQKYFEDSLLRAFIEENTSYYYDNGYLPIVFDKDGIRLSNEEIIEKMSNLSM